MPAGDGDRSAGDREARPPDDAPPEVKRTGKPKYYGAILKDTEAIDLKLLDRADNVRDMVRVIPKARRWAERYLAKTELEIAPIWEACRNERIRQQYQDAIRRLREALEK